MELGIDRYLASERWRSRMAGRRVALLGHPASATRDCRHTLGALVEASDIDLVAAFGPQHGMRGDRQDNMVETADEIHPRHGVPVFSLYGDVRRPTDAMMDAFDVLLVDLQDIGTRIYTYLTTLIYMLEACAEHGHSVWVLDRPNPAGRPVEGAILEPQQASFVGAVPVTMRHGLTLGELALWHVARTDLDVFVKVISMNGWEPDSAPGFGWPLHELAWINPSPNASSLNMARCYPGTVLLEGTTLSEGRGTSTPLELAGAPGIEFDSVLARMHDLEQGWLQGCRIRRCTFEPTFHKHVGETCEGIQIHADDAAYDHESFRPFRLAALLLKALRMERPEYDLWRQGPYEYETDRLAIDLLAGGTFLREWVDDPAAEPGDLDARLRADEEAWRQERAEFFLYGDA